MGLVDCCGFVGLDWRGVVSFGFCSLFGVGVNRCVGRCFGVFVVGCVGDFWFGLSGCCLWVFGSRFGASGFVGLVFVLRGLLFCGLVVVGVLAFLGNCRFVVLLWVFGA